MIVELESGKFRAVHTPTALTPWAGKEFDTYLGAKCWLQLMDERHGIKGPSHAVDVLFTRQPGSPRAHYRTACLRSLMPEHNRE